MHVTPPARRDRFHLFHRARRWNDREGVWMGWERKRGKIEEFNRLLRGAIDTSFTVRRGDPAILPLVRYVHHARQRHAPAARCGPAADRRDRASPQPSSLRFPGRARGRGLRNPPAAGERDDGKCRRLAVRARLRGPHRRRPLLDHGVRHLPGPFRRGQLHRQGALRRRHVHGRARRPRARERDALTRPVRGTLRALRARLRRRGGGRLPLERARRMHAASTAGCAATGRSCSALLPMVPTRHGLARNRICR